jgi:hypothetical protein
VKEDCSNNQYIQTSIAYESHAEGVSRSQIPGNIGG